MAQKFVAPNTLFDSSVAFLKQVSLNSTVIFDNVSLITVDTSAEGLSQLDTALATSGAIRAYVDNAAGGKDEFSELLDVSIGTKVAGDLVQYNAVTQTWDNASLVTLDIATLTYVDGSLAIVDGSITALFNENDIQDLEISQLDASIVNLEANKVNIAGDTMTGALTVPDVSVTNNLWIDSVTISAIDTSAEGLGQLETALATSAAIKSYVDSVAGGKDEFNELNDVSIASRVNGDVVVYNASTATWDNEQPVEAFDFFYTKAYIDGSLATIDGSITALFNENDVQNVTLNQIDASLIAIDAYQLIQDASILSAGSSTDGWNGITRTDNSIGLGGALDFATTINTNGNNFSITDSDASGGFSMTDDGAGNINTFIGGNDQGFSYIRFPGIIEGVSMYLDNKVIRMTSTITGIQIQDNDDSLGMKYFTDYSANGVLNPRWIPDYAAVKAYVDASISGSTANAWNGLSKTDNSIGLGGTLDIATTITTSAAETLTIAGLQVSADNTPEALVMDTVGGVLKYRQLGTMAWETATDYTTQALFDSSLLAIDAYQVIQDGSISALETAQGNYVLKAGDTMTGSLTITGGGLQVGEIGTPQDVSIYSNLYVHNGATIGGDLIIDGSLLVRSVETIDVSGAFILLNTGQTGTPPASMQSGIVIDRGDEIPYVFLYDESTQDFRIGIAPVAAGPSYDDASTQAVATREDTPITGGIGYWNNTLSRIDTDASITFAGATGFQVDTLVTLTDLANDGAEFTGVLINGSNELVTREFGTGAFATIANFATIAYVDASLVTRDGSITALFDENDVQDTLIANNDTSIAANWTLINTNISDIATNVTNIATNASSITDLSTGKIDAVASTTGVSGHEVYSNESDNVAYVKRLVAGSGATLTSDSSIITIAVTGATGFMSKYTDTFSPDGSTSIIIPFGTHGLSNDTSTYVISVFEGDTQVFPEITSVAVSGQITITWTLGSLTNLSRYIITG